jgi:hypothetical protein
MQNRKSVFGSSAIVMFVALHLLLCGTALAGSPPLITTMPVMSAGVLVADNTTQYTATMTVTDPDGYSDLRDTRMLFNFKESGGDPSLGRGYMAWGPSDADITRYGSTWVTADATGGGRWGYCSNTWGGTTYITPLGCSITVAGNATGGAGSRTFTWTFIAKPAWAWNPLTNNANAWAADYTGAVGWIDNPATFDVVASACAYYSAVPQAPIVGNPTINTVQVSIDPADSSSDVFIICIWPSINGKAYVQTDGTIGYAPKWQSRSTWGTKTVTGLMWNTPYTFSTRAARNTSGYCPSNFGPESTVTTLQHVPQIDYLQGTPFSEGVRGQCPFRALPVSGYQVIWDFGRGSLARGLGGGLDADCYDWRDINTGMVFYYLAGGRFTMLEFLQYARDFNTPPMITANAFGGGYRDPNNGNTFVCQYDNPEGQAADCVRYCNFILQNYRQGSEGSMTGEDLRVYNSIVDWAGKPKLPAPGEGAVPPVFYWEIGNEPELGGIPGCLTNHYLSPTDYRDRYKPIALAMKAVDPRVKLGPCLINPSDPNGSGLWLSALAADPTIPMEFVAYHPYYSDIKSNWGNPSAMTDALRTMKAFLKSKTAGIRTIMTNNNRTNYGLIATEWNPVNWDAPGNIQLSVSMALGVAESVFTYAEDGVEGANFWEFPQDKPCVTEMFRGLRDYMGDTLVANTESLGLSSDNVNFRIYVTKRIGDDNTLMIWGLNFHDDQIVQLDLSIPYTRFVSGLLRRYGNPTGDTNLMMNAGMAWTEQPVTGIDAGNFTLTMADAETTVLIMQIAPTTPADFDRDGDVDQADFGHLQACMLGPGVNQADPACGDCLLNGDYSVDQEDLTFFLRCFEGPGILVDSHCAD